MHAELHQVVVGKLRIQQHIPPLPQAGDKINQRDFGRVGRG